MKLKQLFYLLPACMVLFQSCSEDENLGEGFKPQTYNVSGKVEKGPFISGSTITIQPMNEKLQVLGSLYATTIQDDMGNFSFGSKMFEAPYAELTANGYFSVQNPSKRFRSFSPLSYVNPLERFCLISPAI